MNKKYCLSIIILLPFFSLAQKESRIEKNKKAAEKISKLQRESESGTIIFNKQSAFKFSLNTDGFAVGFEKGKYKSVDKTNLWWFDLGERRSTKEEKVTPFSKSQTLDGNPYKYGKINNFYFTKIGFAQQRLLGSKNTNNGIAIQLNYGGGLSLGLLKPYYIDVLKHNSNIESEVIKYDDDPVRFLDSDSIIGAAPFGKGFGEMKLVPGAFGKIGVRFDYGKLHDLVAAIEIGVNAEFYTQKMPIMALAKEKNFFINGYLSLIFGSRK